jgi:hypothetical protein
MHFVQLFCTLFVLMYDTVDGRRIGRYLVSAEHLSNLVNFHRLYRILYS